MKTIITASVLVSMVCTAFAQTQMELKRRLDQLEERVAKLEAASGKSGSNVEGKLNKEEIVEGERNKARARARKDLEVYSADDLSKIEKLYQVANKEWRSEEARASLKELIAKYDKSNRTGCALLYMGQMSKGDEQIDYLTKAIEGFSDCHYLNGVQVGAYARMYLAFRYKQDGKADKAKALFEEIAAQYPNAIDHRGNLVSDIIARESK